MVLFARFRPGFKKVVICAAIISTLAAAGIGTKKLMSHNQANSAYSEILRFEEGRTRTEDSMKKINDLLMESVDIKALADRLLEEGKKEEGKQAYLSLLEKYRQVIAMLTTPDETGNHIALAKNQIIRIKTGLEGNNSFDENRNDIAALEKGVYDAWVEVDKLTKSVSNEYQEVERIIRTID